MDLLQHNAPVFLIPASMDTDTSALSYSECISWYVRCEGVISSTLAVSRLMLHSSVPDTLQHLIFHDEIKPLSTYLVGPFARTVRQEASIYFVSLSTIRVYGVYRRSRLGLLLI